MFRYFPKTLKFSSEIWKWQKARDYFFHLSLFPHKREGCRLKTTPQPFQCEPTRIKTFCQGAFRNNEPSPFANQIGEISPSVLYGWRCIMMTQAIISKCLFLWQKQKQQQQQQQQLGITQLTLECPKPGFLTLVLTYETTRSMRKRREISRRNRNGFISYTSWKLHVLKKRN